MMPLREQQLAEITRDYSQAKSNYESLLAKKNQSEMAASLEKRQGGELFKIIDPPNLPQKPYKPDRLTFSLLGLAVGMILALALTALVETLDARIYREEDLRDLISTPILGGIPLLQSESEERRARQYQQLEIVAASVLLAAIPAMTFFAYYRN
jgi:capsular polysaccharide biosynthesis protein